MTVRVRLTCVFASLALTLAASSHADDSPPPAPAPPSAPLLPPSQPWTPLGPGSTAPASPMFSAPVARPATLALDAPTPPGTHAEQRPKAGFTGGAIAVLAVSYGTSFTAAVGCKFVSGCGDAGNWLFLPVVGPFGQMAVTHSPVGNAFLAIDGVAQGLGVMMIVAARLFPDEVFVASESRATVRVAPLMGSSGRGLALVGSF